MKTTNRVSMLALAVLSFAALAGCGGGGSNNPPPPPPGPSAPSGLSYPSPQVYTRNAAIASLAPTVVGTVTSYSVTPALPAGLTINATSGALSGTPTALSAATSYTVTASNAGGSTIAMVNIAVNDVAPTVAYLPASRRLATGAAYTLTPTLGGGSVISWSVTPALPAGLVLDATTGVVSGTPTTAAPSASYQVRAENSGGQTTANLTLTVSAGTLLELGHTYGVTRVYATASRVASLDESGHWVLWDRATAALVAKGGALCCSGGSIALSGNTFVTYSLSTFEIRNATTGAVTGRFDRNAAWWKLAADGSYVVSGTIDGIEARAADGSRTFLVAGNYGHADVFAAPAEIRVARGARGEDVIETLSPVTGGSTLSPLLSGVFKTWLSNGEHFLTLAGNVVNTYTRSGVSLGLTTLSEPAQLFGGGGNYFWATRAGVSGTLYFYRLGANTLQVDSTLLPNVATLVQSGSSLALESLGNLAVFDLSASTVPARTDHALTTRGFAALAANDWLAGEASRLVDGASLATTPRRFGIGAVRSITGSPDRVVIATARGDVISLNLATRAIEGTILYSARRVKLSADGAVLGAHGEDGASPPLRIYSMPSRTQTMEWTYGATAPERLAEFSLSADGSMLALSLGDYVSSLGFVTVTRTAGPTAGGPRTFSDSLTFDSFDLFGRASWPWVRMSPNGRDVAVSSGKQDSNIGSSLYRDGVLVAAVIGASMGWVDAERILVDRFIPAGRDGRYNGSRLFSRTGTNQGDVVFGVRPFDFEVASATTIYVPGNNTIYSLSNPTDVAIPTWTSSTTAEAVSTEGAPRGALAGAFVAFIGNGEVRLEPY